MICSSIPNERQTGTQQPHQRQAQDTGLWGRASFLECQAAGDHHKLPGCLGKRVQEQSKQPAKENDAEEPWPPACAFCLTTPPLPVPLCVMCRMLLMHRATLMCLPLLGLGHRHTANAMRTTSISPPPAIIRSASHNNRGGHRPITPCTPHSPCPGLGACCLFETAAPASHHPTTASTLIPSLLHPFPPSLHTDHTTSRATPPHRFHHSVPIT